MRRAGIALVALPATALLVSCNQDAVDLVEALAPDTDTVHINFTCGGTNDEIGLDDTHGNSAWAFQRRPNNPITWTVDQTVTINSIKGKNTPLPVDHDPSDPGGQQPGVSYKAKVKGNPPGPVIGKKSFSYAIDLTCNQNGVTRRLVIDPEMIIRKP